MVYECPLICPLHCHLVIFDIDVKCVKMSCLKGLFTFFKNFGLKTIKQQICCQCDHKCCKLHWKLKLFWTFRETGGTSETKPPCILQMLPPTYKYTDELTHLYNSPHWENNCTLTTMKTFPRKSVQKTMVHCWECCLSNVFQTRGFNIMLKGMSSTC